jgi:flavin-dependent dehydrogenase
LVGNAAGEAHPVVAEGISMAMQGAWLLCQRLIEERAHRLSDAALRNIGVAYERDWRRHFAPRILAAALFAHLAMRPIPSVICLQLLKRFPQLLGCGARWSGKIHQVVERPVRLAAANPSG